jgi:hypothetical protein
VTVDYLACMTAPRSHLLCTVLALAALPALAQEPLTDRLVRDAVREAAAMESPAPAKVEAPVKFGKTEARQKQIDRLFQQAADAAPPKLYEAPKITEYNDGSPYGRRIYRSCSKKHTAAQAATFSDSTWPACGITTWCVASSSRAAATPCPSWPNSQATGRRRSTSYRRCVA